MGKRRTSKWYKLGSYGDFAVPVVARQWVVLIVVWIRLDHLARLSDICVTDARLSIHLLRGIVLANYGVCGVEE